MSDLTVYAEGLIAAITRAFYDDDCVVLVDVLIAQKFLRDDDMSQRLSLPSKKLRATLQFLQEEHLVRSETVDDLAQGGSQATKFYYLDYNRAVHSIRLRLYLLRQKLEQAELRSRSNSFYLCPGYKLKRCNGQYTEEEAQQVVDASKGLFLCQECSRMFENDPNPPSIDTYTLQLIDNTKDLRIAMDNLRRVSVQLSSKSVGNSQMRIGIYDLLQKVRGNDPITSNLPSENYALGIGSQRLAGTGRTANIKARKLEQQGVAESAAQAQKYLVGGGRDSRDDMLFLKSALGQEIQCNVERGGGAQAQFLATRKRRRHKKMDAAATRVGSSVPLHRLLEEERKRKEVAMKREEKQDNGRKLMKAGDTFDFLKDNIGLNGKNRLGPIKEESSRDTGDDDALVAVMSDEQHTEATEVTLADDMDAMQSLAEEDRVSTFQNQYKVEFDRQVTILREQRKVDPLASPRHSVVSDDDFSVAWEDVD